MRAHLVANPMAGGGRRVGEALAALRREVPDLDFHFCSDPGSHRPGGTGDSESRARLVVFG